MSNDSRLHFRIGPLLAILDFEIWCVFLNNLFSMTLRNFHAKGNISIMIWSQMSLKGSGAWENSNFGLKTDFLRYYHILTATCVYYCQANDECSQTNFNRWKRQFCKRICNQQTLRFGDAIEWYEIFCIVFLTYVFLFTCTLVVQHFSPLTPSLTVTWE